jgi:hypothetical protein
MWPATFVILAFAVFVAHYAESAASDSYCISSTIGTRAGVGSCADGDVFLKGQYIEVGVHNVASFGTSRNAPSPYVYNGKKLGFIADFDKNGFSSSSPGFAGDYFIPGQPVEG